jgi:hypothetical protein
MGIHRYKHKRINGKKNSVHRHIMEAHLGRELTTDEHVYHLNGNPDDNSIENLVVITKNARKKPKGSP